MISNFVSINNTNTKWQLPQPEKKKTITLKKF